MFLRGRTQVRRTRIWTVYVALLLAILVSLGVNLISYLVATQLNAPLLAISVIAVLLPAAFHFSVVDNVQFNETSDILNVSHGVGLSVPSPKLVLTSFRLQSYYYFVSVSSSKPRRRLNSTIVYISYSVFQLISHAALYDGGEDMIKSKPYASRKHKVEPSIGLQIPETLTVSSATSTTVGHRLEPGNNSDVESGSSYSKEGVEQPQLGVWVTVGLLTVVTVVNPLHFCLLLSCAEMYISWLQLPLSG